MSCTLSSRLSEHLLPWFGRAARTAPPVPLPDASRGLAPGRPDADDAPRARCGRRNGAGDRACERSPLHRGKHAAGSPVEEWWWDAPTRVRAPVSRLPNTSLGTASWLRPPPEDPGGAPAPSTPGG